MKVAGRTLFPIALAAALAAAAAAGCASNAPVPFDEREAIRARMKAPPPPLPFRVAVAPVGGPPEVPAPAEGEAERETAALDGEAIRRALASILERHRLFERTRLAGPGEAADGAPAPSGRAPRAGMAEAFAAGDDLVLRVRIERAEVSFAGLNGFTYVLNWLNWWMFWASSWVVADERYALDLEAEAEVVSVRSERTLERRAIRVRSERSLDDFERGLVFPGLPYLPGWIGKENLRLAGTVLGPFALDDLYLEILRWLDGPVRARGPGLLEADGTTLSLAVGISRYQDYALHNIRFAAADAEAFHGALLAEGRVPPKNATLLSDEAATAAAFRRALAAIAARAGPADEIVVYFAGYAAPAAPGGPAVLVCFDGAGEAPGAGGLTLEEVVAALRGSRAHAAILVLDSALSGGAAGRSLAPEDAGGSLALAVREAGGGPALITVAADAPGEKDGACEVASLKHGLLTYYLVKAFEGAADRDRDRRVTWAEALRFAASEVATHAELEGKRQHPAIAGPTAALRQSFGAEVSDGP